MTNQNKIFGIRACRSAISMFGRSYAWLKSNDQVLKFDNKKQAQSYIDEHELNKDKRFSCVSYNVAEMD